MWAHVLLSKAKLRLAQAVFLGWHAGLLLSVCGLPTTKMTVSAKTPL